MKDATGLKFGTGEIIRIPVSHGFRVWMVTGVCLGPTNSESNYQLRPLDLNTGEAVGGKVTENLVPCDLLETHMGIHRIPE